MNTICKAYFTAACLTFAGLDTVHSTEFPTEMNRIMEQKKYDHAIWGIYAKDMESGEILYDLNSEKLFSPASTSKLFSVAALINAFGDDYRFKTPVYADGKVIRGELKGNLILVAQGDLTFGGRQLSPDAIAFTKMDHVNANDVPGVILTKQDPLLAFNDLARQIAESGINKISGDVLIDDRLFETTEKRGMSISPMMINENFIDIVINPSEAGQKALLKFQPAIPSYKIDNQVITVSKDEANEIHASIEQTKHLIVIKGTISTDQKDVVRTVPIQNPKSFAREAFIQALQKQGIKLNANPASERLGARLPDSYDGLKPLALWTSAPLSEYAKLVLKVSHNVGADLIPMLLASKNNKKTFEEGMLLFGDFISHEVGISPDEFVFIDAAGGNENRTTLQAAIKLLEYMYHQKPEQFRHFFEALPILGVDGSLEDFAKSAPGAGKVRAKTGTSASFNLATQEFFLITQALAGYVEGKNGHLIAFEVIVNNGSMPVMNDIYGIFEDEGQLSSLIYEHSQTQEPAEALQN